ncbi:MAG TPA: phosphoribosylanthranilate isomerase [Vicinamibacterales bacterium]|nr:phosphoribosylanthranilate isomerase [Vicinamibacterales bacterium]
MTRVKICGITREEDAVLAAALGASAVGFVFWPGSPRAVMPRRARQIVRALPPLVSVVGVFVDQPFDEVEATAAAVPLDAVQLHGDECPRDWARLRQRMIRAVTAERLEEAEAWSLRVTLLVDAVEGSRRGGTGRCVDWQAVAPVARRRPVILAGGLSPDNVARAICTVHPFAVDVASGVESSPGVKDPARLRAFFAAVAGVEADRP